MASETDINKPVLPEKDDLGEGPEDYEGEDSGRHAADEDDKPANPVPGT